MSLRPGARREHARACPDTGACPSTPSSTPPSDRFRREILIALALKLVALLVLQHWPLPPRLSPDQVAQGLDARLSTPPTPPTPGTSPKENP
ncbi:hypothetical protein [Ideonella sp. B508-1]|uniref:hypothetical protein n=1 Tax=Ideonella sp. B508-1 TaxID=137716 RepID=UPI0003474B0F|nr:hypothetical protein [Ideonella sp. B508-1]